MSLEFFLTPALSLNYYSISFSEKYYKKQVQLEWQHKGAGSVQNPRLTLEWFQRNFTNPGKSLIVVVWKHKAILHVGQCDVFVFLLHSGMAWARWKKVKHSMLLSTALAISRLGHQQVCIPRGRRCAPNCPWDSWKPGSGSLDARKTGRILVW